MRNGQSRAPVCLLAIASAAFLLLAPPVFGQEKSELGTWQTLAPSPTERSEVTAAALDGKIYVVGGFSKPSLGSLRH